MAEGYKVLIISTSSSSMVVRLAFLRILRLPTENTVKVVMAPKAITRFMGFRIR